MRMKKLLAIGLVSLQLLSFGCAQRSDSYDAMNMVEHAKEQEQEELAHIKLTKQEDMDKQYGNGLYFEDLDEVRKNVNEQYQNYIEKLFKSKTNHPLIVRVDAVFYNESLLKIKQGQLDDNDVIENAGDHLRSLEIHLYGFAKPDEYVKRSDFFEFIKAFQLELDVFKFEPNLIHFSVYDQTVLEDDSSNLLESNKTIDELYIYLSSFNRLLDMNTFTKGGVQFESEQSRFNQDAFNEYTSSLEEQFNEPFIYTPYALFPENDPDLKIHKPFSARLYTKLMAQKIMAEEINKIIEEEGGYPRIVQYTAAVSSDESKTSEVVFDVQKDFDRLEFLRETYYGSFDTNILYLKTVDEGIDFDLLYRVLDRVLGIYAESYTRPQRHHGVFVYFYNVDVSDYEVISDLFQEQTLYVPGSHKNSGIQDIYANMYVTHINSDGYYYLDVYGEKEEYLLNMHPIEEEDRNYSPEELLKMYRDKDLFGGDYEHNNW